MSNLKKELKSYLLRYGRSENLVDIYNKFPYSGHNLTNKQKGDRVRTVWRKLKKQLPTQAKILVYDLETSPLLGYVWRLWKQNVHPTNGQLTNQVMILSWSAKWLYDTEVMNDYMTPEEIKNEDDSRVVESIAKLVDEADIVIFHNGMDFDAKVLNGRMFVHQMEPPSPYQMIDTKRHASKRFRLESNKLDYLAMILGLGRKKPTNFDLWASCMKGDEEAMKYMVSYCDEDVRILEAIYLKMRPWIKPHPNVNLIVEQTENQACPTCSSKKVKDQGFYRTYSNTYKALKCNNCKSTFRVRTAIKINKEGLLVSTPN